MTSKPIILAVDDDDDFRGRFAVSARSWGCEVMEARDGEQAIEILKDHAPRINVAVVDLVLPGDVSGLDVILMLTHHPNVPTRIVAISAVWKQTQLELVKYVGVDAVLPKSAPPTYFAESEWSDCLRNLLPGNGDGAGGGAVEHGPGLRM